MKYTRKGKAMQRTFIVRQIAYKKDSKYLAVCLDLDLMAEGCTMGEAIDRLRDAVFGYLEMCVRENESNRVIYRKAPKKYFDLFDLFKDLEEKNKPKPETIVSTVSYKPSVFNAHFCNA